ncbi:hypothetical protein, partial [Rhodoblastus acidophilus]
ARRPTVAHHVHRTPRLGAWVLISETWYKSEMGEKFDIYEDWDEMPRDAFLIDFWDKGDGTFSFEGFFNTDAILGTRRKNGSNFQVIKEVSSIPTNTCLGTIAKAGLGPLSGWSKILSRIKAQSPEWAEEWGCCIQLSEIAQWLEAETAR